MIGAKVLVTGITGFLGSRVCLQCLEKGYQVKGTVRSQNPAKLKVIEQFPSRENLEIVEANLLDSAEEWKKAIEGCKYILHTASPFPSELPKKESELIEPAMKGTMNVIQGAKECGNVEHIVITSSTAAIVSLFKDFKNDFHTEEDWANCDVKGFPPYEKSKTMAERAVWQFYKSQGEENRMKITVINPGWIVGPTLVDTAFTSSEVPKLFLTGKMPGIPRISFGTVDVRDVAKAHLLALEKGEIADGKRYICVSDSLWLSDVAQVLRDEFTQYGYKVTNRNIPYCGAKFASFFQTKAKLLLPWIGKHLKFNTSNIKNDLGMEFIPLKEGILELAYSCIKIGIITDKINPTEGKGKKQKKPLKE